MAKNFDSRRIAELGWRQGAILGEELADAALDHAPTRLALNCPNRLMLTSHDCDILNGSLEKEPIVEVLHLEATTAAKLNRLESFGRNPRILQFEHNDNGKRILLTCVAHHRWMIPRQSLMQESPASVLPRSQCRLVADWLAKRYNRFAFPTAFDRRWRFKQKDWLKLLQKNSELVQGVYIRLHSLDELCEHVPYRTHILVAVPHYRLDRGSRIDVLSQIERDVLEFWTQFEPSIRCVGVQVTGTDNISLATIEPYQRFDADWISLEDNTPITPPVIRD